MIFDDGKKPANGEMWFPITDQTIFAVAGFWQLVKDEGSHFAMVTCDANALVAPVHPEAMISVLEETDQERWMTDSYEEAVGLQRPYPAERMTLQGPVFPRRIA